MEERRIPTTQVLTRKASILVNCDLHTAYEFISSGEKLPLWLKKSGPVPAATGVEVLEGPYDHPGARRKVQFVGGDSLIEELMTLDPPASYNYSVTQFTNFLEKLSGQAYGQLWFDHIDGQTRITWAYSFHYKNVLKRMILFLFLTFVYKKFLNQSLQHAKAAIEQG